MEWPVVPGRYKVGNKNSPVAVCTMASVDLTLPLDNISMVGKTVTENVGIEKIVKNIVSNTNIRFLICCGKISKGHFVSDALECLVKNGVDGEKRIVGAKGAMPIVKNLTEEQIEHFRKQVKVICMQGEEDVEKIMKVVNECIKNNPGAFRVIIPRSEKVKTIVADYDKDKHFTADEKKDDAWFTIVLDKDNKNIIVERYIGYGPEAKHDCNIVGKTTEQIMGTIVKRKLISSLYHATYLSKELQKAELALKENKDYEQDGNIEFWRTVGTVIFNDKNQVLLIKRSEDTEHSPGKWEIPSGKVESRETLKQAAKRETKEEAGVDVEIGRYVDTYYATIEKKDGSKFNASMDVFLAKIIEGRIKPSSDACDCRWVSINELDRIDLMPSMKECILDAKKFS